MRIIGAAGMSGRHLRPLVNMGGGGGGQVMLVAGREKVHFHGMTNRINPCLASEVGQSKFRIDRDEENGEDLERQRSTEVSLGSPKPFERLLFSMSTHATETSSVASHGQKKLKQQGKPFPHTPKCLE